MRPHYPCHLIQKDGNHYNIDYKGNMIITLFFLHFHFITLTNDLRWMVEKYNGTRVFWNGTTLQVAQNRTPIQIPNWIRSGLPRIAFEAEM